MSYDVGGGEQTSQIMHFSIENTPQTFSTTTKLNEWYEDANTFAASAVLDIAIPLAIFRKQHSGLQAIVHYLHDTLHFSFATIGRLLQRTTKTIWASYHQTGPLEHVESGGETIPLSLFQNRTLSILETLVHFLEEKYRLKNIATLLAKDSRTIWTVQQRIKRKQHNA